MGCVVQGKSSIIKIINIYSAASYGGNIEVFDVKILVFHLKPSMVFIS